MRRIFTCLLSLALVFSLIAGALPVHAETTEPPAIPEAAATEETTEAAVESAPETAPPTEPETAPATETEPATEAPTESATEPETEPGTESPAEPAELTADVHAQVGELSVTVHDAPAGAELAAEEVHRPSLLSAGGSRGVETLFDRSYNLKLFLGDDEYRPENGSVTVSVRGFGDPGGDELVVTHYLDASDAVERALKDGRGYTYTAEGLAELYPRACGAVETVTGRKDTICYTIMTRQNGGLSCRGGAVSFQTDSFSTFNIRRYRLLHGQPVIPGIESDKPEDRMVLNKFAAQEDDGSLSLYLESYATGFMKARPTEIVLVMDQSGSMYSAMNSSRVYSYEEFLDSHPSGSGNETCPGYYLCMTKNSVTGEGHQSHAAALVWWNGSSWVRSQQMEISETDYFARKTGFTYPDSKIRETASLEGHNYDTSDAVYFKTVSGAAMDAMQAFLGEIEGLPGCRVAVTGFASPKYKIQNAYADGKGLWESGDTASGSLVPRRMGGTGVYVNGTLHVDGVDLNSGDYGRAFLGADDAEEFGLLRQTIQNIQTSYWNTVTDAGFLHANEIFKAGGGEDASRIVVLFTDGRPDSTSSGSGDAAQAAIAAADVTKTFCGAQVYVFGPADLNTDPEAADLMNSLSSNGDGENRYVGFADDAESLKKFFAQLGQKIVYDNFLMGPDTVLRDVVSDSFTFEARAVEAWSVPVIRDAALGRIVFDNDPAHWKKLEGEISAEGQAVSVKGFDYRANLIPAGQDDPDYTGEPTGAKLVVKIPIQVAEAYDDDGQNVPTNGPGSGIFDKDGHVVNSFREPKVDLSTAVTVKKTVVGRDTGEAFGFGADYSRVDHYEDNGGIQADALQAGGNSFGGNTLDAVTVSEHTSFKLKNGGQTVLEQVSIGSFLVIRETENSLYRTAVKVNGIPQPLDEHGVLRVCVTPNMRVEFINTSRRADLTIVKRGADDRDKNQTFLFRIRGLEEDNAHISLTVTALGNDRVTVKELPVGRYEISEDESWSWRYEAVSMESAGERHEGPTIEIQLPAEGQTVTCTNRRTEDTWLDGSSCCQNIFGINGIETAGGRGRE